MDSKRKSRFLYVKIILAVGVGVFFILQAKTVSSLIEPKIISFSGSLMRVSLSAGGWFQNISALFKNKQRLSEENEHLYERLTSARTKLVAYDSVREENDRLKEALGRKSSEKSLLALVLSRPNRSPYDTFFLDLGSEDGVAEGMLVAYENVALGIISSVSPSISKVVLFSSPNIKLDVLVGAKRTPASALGLGGGLFESKLPKEVPLAEGDSVMFPSLNHRIVGTVQSVSAEAPDAFATILFRSPINIFTSQFVTVIPNSQEETDLLVHE